MDIVSLLYFVLFIVVIIVLGVFAAHATLLSLIVGIVFILVILIILAMIIRYSEQLQSAPIIERMEHPLPLIGGLCEVLDEITPTKPGYVRYRGELWKAFSVRSNLSRGDYAYVVDVRGRFLIIEREPKIEEFS